MCDLDMDLSHCVTVPFPHPEKIGRKLTLGLSHGAIAYFKEIGDELGLPAERIMEIYLRNAAYTGYKIDIDIPNIDQKNHLAVTGDRSGG